MNSSADTYILFKIAELAKRYGLRPSEADASIQMVDFNSLEELRYELDFGVLPGDHEKHARFEQMAATLGCNEEGVLRVRELSEIEDAVERALSLAPRARTF